MCLAMLSQLLQHIIERFQNFFLRFGSEVTLKDSKKTSSCESQLQINQNDNCVKKLKNEKFENLLHENVNMNIPKILNLRQIKYDSEVGKNSSIVVEFSKLPDTSTEKTILKRKNQLKRRKRVRPVSSCESNYSDSDITLNDSSTDDEYFSGGSDSDEMISSESEDLDETLLIIDQKIKEKKNKINEKEGNINGVGKEIVKENDKQKSEMNSLLITNKNQSSVKEISKNGINDLNSIKMSNEKDRTKSLFTIINDVHNDNKINENNRGDFTFDYKTVESNTPNGHSLPSAIDNKNETGNIFILFNLISNSNLLNNKLNIFFF